MSEDPIEVELGDDMVSKSVSFAVLKVADGCLPPSRDLCVNERAILKMNILQRAPCGVLSL
jgi:hypothetical protein